MWAASPPVIPVVSLSLTPAEVQAIPSHIYVALRSLLIESKLAAQILFWSVPQMGPSCFILGHVLFCENQARPSQRTIAPLSPRAQILLGLLPQICLRLFLVPLACGDQVIPFHFSIVPLSPTAHT